MIPIYTLIAIPQGHDVRNANPQGQHILPSKPINKEMYFSYEAAVNAAESWIKRNPTDTVMIQVPKSVFSAERIRINSKEWDEKGQLV